MWGRRFWGFRWWGLFWGRGISSEPEVGHDGPYMRVGWVVGVILRRVEEGRVERL